MAQSVSDVMWRRTGLGLSRHGGAETADRVAGIMGMELRWSDTQAAASKAEYLAGRQT